MTVVDSSSSSWNEFFYDACSVHFWDPDPNLVSENLKHDNLQFHRSRISSDVTHFYWEYFQLTILFQDIVEVMMKALSAHHAAD